MSSVLHLKLTLAEMVWVAAVHLCADVNLGHSFTLQWLLVSGRQTWRKYIPMLLLVLEYRKKETVSSATDWFNSPRGTHAFIISLFIPESVLCWRAVLGGQMICPLPVYSLSCWYCQCSCGPTSCPLIIAVGAAVLVFAPWASSCSLVPAPKGNSCYEWWPANAIFFQVLSRGQWTFFPLSFFVWVSLSWYLCHVTVPQVLKVSSVRDLFKVYFL